MAQNPPDASLDAEIELKKRSRRRLVGATALALLAAVVLPMVMDHEPKPAGQDIQVRIPSQEAGGFASRILPTKPAATPLPAPESKPVAAPVAQEAKPEAAKAESAKPETPKPEAPAAKVPAAKVAEAPVVKPEPPKVAPKAAEKIEVAKAEEARAAAALAGNEREQWVVQLGAYKDAGNVKSLLAKLKQLNVPAYTESFASPNGPRT
ncbi:MAG TPA: SPOR domain-containing protein, partial [Rhodocyclaceae bacterium]|nr:SPOR domain-containing protein [Rhodocyclaceae bacterium]